MITLELELVPLWMHRKLLIPVTSPPRYLRLLLEIALPLAALLPPALPLDTIALLVAVVIKVVPAPLIETHSLRQLVDLNLHLPTVDVILVTLPPINRALVVLPVVTPILPLAIVAIVSASVSFDMTISLTIPPSVPTDEFLQPALLIL